MKKTTKAAVVVCVLTAGAVLLYPFAVNLFSSVFYDRFKDEPAVLAAVAASIASLAVLAVVLWWQGHRQDLRGEFDLFVESASLRPEDMGFQVVQQRVEPTDIMRRPYVAGTYIGRTAVPFDERHADKPSRVYDEALLRAELLEGKSFVLFGMPTEGKTRTLFEIVSRLHGHLVVRPKVALPSERALELLRGKSVVCLFDDINQAQERGIDLAAFYEAVSRIAGRCAVAAGCRDGMELAAVERGLTLSPIQRLYAGFPLRLQLKPATVEQKRELAGKLGEDTTRSYFSLGNVSMRRAFHELEPRYRAFEPATRECLWALQLLNHGGVTPITRARVAVVVSEVFNRHQPSATTSRCIAELSRNGFITSINDAEPIVAEAALVSTGEALRLYRDGAAVAADDGPLFRAMLAAADMDAANSIARTRYFRADLEGALQGFEHILDRLQQGERAAGQPALMARALVSAGFLHGQQGRPEEELRFYTRVVELFGHAEEPALRELVAKALFNAGVTHGQQGRAEEALRFYGEVVDRFGHSNETALCERVAKALINAGALHGQQGRAELERACYSEVVTRMGDRVEPALRAVVARAVASAEAAHGPQARA